MEAIAAPASASQSENVTRSRSLQLLGVLCGFTAGAWLGAAEAPTKLVTSGISPVVISLVMVVGVFLAHVVSASRREPRATLDCVGAVGRMLMGDG